MERLAPMRSLKRKKTNSEARTTKVKTDDEAKAATPTTPQHHVTHSRSPASARPDQDQSVSVRLLAREDESGTCSQASLPLQPWYRTWPRKARPITQMADPDDATAEAALTPNNAKTSDSPRTLGELRLSRLVPAETTAATTTTTTPPPPPTTTTATTNGHAARSTHAASTQSLADILGRDGAFDKTADADDGKGVVKADGAVKDAADAADATATEPAEEKDTGKAGWFGWIAKRDSVPLPPEGDGKADNGTASTAKATPQDQDKSPERPDSSETADQTAATSVSPNNKRSWLQMLSGDPSAAKAAAPTPTEAVNPPPKATPISRSKALDIVRASAAASSANQSQASSLEALPPPALPGDANKSSGWVFWSRDRKANSSAGTSDDQPHIGELAVSHTPSQSKPRRASISIANEKPAKPAEPKPEAKAAAKPEPKAAKTAAESRQQPVSAKAGKDSPAPAPGSPKPEQKGSSTTRPLAAKTTDSARQVDKDKVAAVSPLEQSALVNANAQTNKIETTNASAVAKEPTEAASVKRLSSRRSGPHLLLPSFRETLSMEEAPSILQQLTRLFYSTKQAEVRHLSIIKDPPRIRSALAIGVHGYFPAPMLRTILGQPTGTSIKFADMAAKAIARWTKSRGYECEVKTAALEGEGRIAERVELLWSLLINWIGEIGKADFVLVACHSQGVPVAIMLVAKLIQFGCISAARIGVCAMAGVSMGPFVEYKSRWISGSAGELFEFSDPNSRVSEDYRAALDTVLRAGVRLTYVGSIDDQLVSLESSIFAPVTHPHIFRAVSIDPRVHAPSFLSHLVGFVLKLRNLGAQDHGLIRELSSPLAGSLVTGEGHSRLYDDDAIYDLAVCFALETSSLPDIPLVYRRNLATPAAAAGSNPYVLPFAMRGILEEEFARNKLRHEADDLLRQFDEWRPTTKALKDVKFRLEGIRSKL